MAKADLLTVYSFWSLRFLNLIRWRNCSFRSEVVRVDAEAGDTQLRARQFLDGRVVVDIEQGHQAFIGRYGDCGFAGLPVVRRSLQGPANTRSRRARWRASAVPAHINPAGRTRGTSAGVQEHRRPRYGSTAALGGSASLCSRDRLAGSAQASTPLIWRGSRTSARREPQALPQGSAPMTAEGPRRRPAAGPAVRCRRRGLPAPVLAGLLRRLSACTSSGPRHRSPW